ncbi:DNA-3-methyladenine glycosylase 2 family protein [Xanthobacter sp. V4C-4]|uniref:DNA-3-methyladenine glycosylase family protein n=1 Tax=Xanthobacter cornucopiae TaxID=3119924 RepID=UPI00372A6511
MDDVILRDQGVFAAAFARLIALDARLEPLARATGVPALRRRPPGFGGLVGLVVAQQLSVAAARAISERLELALSGVVTPAGMLAAAPELLRQAGLSAPKIRTLTGIAGAVTSGMADLERIAHLSSEAAVAELIRLPGVGRWTADLYLLFCLGRADAFPSGDLALQVALGDGFALGGRCTEPGLLAVAEEWRPLRGVAAHLLWAYYGTCRARAGAPA